MLKATLVLALLLLLPAFSFGQIANDNTLTVQIDGNEFMAQPRRIRIGKAMWMTANTDKPDKSLRIWFGTYDRSDILEPGTYLVIDYENGKLKNYEKKYDLSKYKGIAMIKYVEETRAPRMEYHVGKSEDNGETATITKGADGFLNVTFSGKLAGSYWKERGSATVFGGFGRIVDKAQDKAMTKATGYDADIDPEGNGYKKQSKADEIVLTNGKARLIVK